MIAAHSEKGSQKRDILRGIQAWIVPVLGSIGVILLLMVLAGFFHEKVAQEGKRSVRKIPSDAEWYTVVATKQPRYETAVGTIQPVHEANIASKILARVLEINVTAGQKVEAGDLLVRLSDEELVARKKQMEATREAALAQLQQATSDASRASQLLPTRTISQAEYDSAQTALKTAQAQLDRASRAVDESNVLLEFTLIKAPFSGVVIDKIVEPGDTVSPGQVLLSLYDPSRMQLVANVRESLALQLQVGSQVQAKIESLDHQCVATVSEVVPKAEALSRSFEVKVTGPCPSGIYSGMFGRIFLPLEEETIMLIPQACVERVGQLTYVHVAENENLFRRHVLLGRLFDDRVEVLSGVQIGERIMVGRPSAQGESK